MLFLRRFTLASPLMLALMSYSSFPAQAWIGGDINTSADMGSCQMFFRATGADWNAAMSSTATSAGEGFVAGGRILSNTLVGPLTKFKNEILQACGLTQVSGLSQAFTGEDYASMQTMLLSFNAVLGSGLSAGMNGSKVVGDGKTSYDFLFLINGKIDAAPGLTVKVTPAAAQRAATQGQSGSKAAVAGTTQSTGPHCHEWDLQTTFVTGGKTCVTDSLRPYKSINYGAANLSSDGAWCVEENQGQFPAATLSYFGYGEDRKSPGFARLMVENGYTKSDDAFRKNARAKTVIVSSGNFYQEAFVLQDTADLQYIDLGYEIAPEELQVEIIDTYAGSRFPHVCVSNLSADFEYDPSFKSDYDINATPLDIRKALALKAARQTQTGIPTPRPRPRTANSADAPSNAPATGSSKFTDARPASTIGIAKGDTPQPLSIKDYKLLAGWPADMAGGKFGEQGERVRFAIIDLGFSGLAAYLEDNPGLKKRVMHLDLREETNRPKAVSGLNVLRIVQNMLPDTTEFLAISLPHGGTRKMASAVKAMNERGFHYGTTSLGTTCCWDRERTDERKLEFLQLLEKSQTTLFVAAGNLRQRTHSVEPTDIDGDGIFEVFPNAKTDAAREGIEFQVDEGTVGKIQMVWGKREGATGTVSIKLTRNGKTIHEHDFREAIGGGAVNTRSRNSSHNYRLEISYKNLSRPIRQLRLGRQTRIHLGQDWNGHNSGSDLATWDSPFLVSVGSVGNMNGELRPTLFSSIDVSGSGEIVPLVMGPDQLEFGGIALRGTGNSAAVAAALYTIAGAHNVRNFVQKTSGFDAFAAGQSRMEVSRWGSADFEKIVANFKNACGLRKGELSKPQIRDGELTATVTFSRGCMEKMNYAVKLGFETVQPTEKAGKTEYVTTVIGGERRELAFFEFRKSDRETIEDEVIEFRGSLHGLEDRFRDVEVRPYVKLFTRQSFKGAHLVKERTTLRLPR